MSGTKVTVEAPDWAEEEEKGWAFEVARFIYGFSDKEYLDAPRTAVSDSIEVVKVTWGKDRMGQYIDFMIVLSPCSLDKFVVFVRCRGTPINGGEPLQMLVYVQVITQEPLARMSVGRKGDVVTHPQDTARRCVEGIRTAVCYQRYQLLRKVNMLEQIDGALRKNFQEDQTLKPAEISLILNKKEKDFF